MGWGDEIMVTGEAKRMMRSDPRRVEVLDRNGLRRWNALWDGNPNIAKPNERGNFQQLKNGPGIRPYHLGKSDTVWTYNFDYRPESGDLFFTSDELEFAAKFKGRLILEPSIKGKASPNKQWGWMNWSKLNYLLQSRGHRVTQIGPHGTPLLEGAEHIVTPDFRHAAAVLSVARAAVLPEGGLHHAAAAVGLRAVVIYGGYIPVELTGYALHTNIGVSLQEACGMRVPCEHCEKIMAGIKSNSVLLELEKLL